MSNIAKIEAANDAREAAIAAAEILAAAEQIMASLDALVGALREFRTSSAMLAEKLSKGG